VRRGSAAPTKAPMAKPAMAQSPHVDPACPCCSRPTAKRTAKRGANACRVFRGCTAYAVTVNPMFTGTRNGANHEFYRLIGVEHDAAQRRSATRTAPCLDPHTGVHKKASKQHVCGLV
jgi:hypothetical protein